MDQSTAEYHAPLDGDAPPAFSDVVDNLDVRQHNLNSSVRVTGDGRVNITLNEKARLLSTFFGPALDSYAHVATEPEAAPAYDDAWGPASSSPSAATGTALQEHDQRPPSLNIVIQAVGSRGDVQPFVALGQTLKSQYGHRVRIATHSVFKSFVEEEGGLEFFSIGGDPSQLMAYMVKHPGLLPGFNAFTKGHISERRKSTYVMLQGCWRSCIEPAEDSDICKKQFTADVIIANPPSFAHIHCAQKLSIPLHIMFTMPWTSTQSFPHPLANIESSNLEPGHINFFSYFMVEMIIWQGLSNVINRFRVKVLGMEPIGIGSGTTLLSRQQIPHTYCWSPALIPKPKDWGANTSVAGFYFLRSSPDYNCDPALTEFLASGPTPIYIGFGSIVVDDPEAMTNLILDAIAKTGQRALISRGWGDLGSNQALGSPRVHFLGSVPHDWLFRRVSCVVHHGGAGTTAAGIAAGRPTVIVPFFGDQQFWGDSIARVGAGPRPIPKAKLTAENLACAIQEALEPATSERAKDVSRRIASEAGCDVGARAFHEKLPKGTLRCPISPSNTTVWKVKGSKDPISALGAAVLLNNNIIKIKDLRLCRHVKYDLSHGPYDPVTGSILRIFDVLFTVFKAIADVPVESFRAAKATKTTSTSFDVDDKVGSSGSSARANRVLNGVERSSSSNDMNKPQALPIAQNSGSIDPGSLIRATTAPPDYRAEDESEDELEADLEVAELPGEPLDEGFMTRSSSDTNTGTVVRSQQSSTTENDQSSVGTSNTRTGLKYVGNAVKGTGIGLTKSVSRLTMEAFKMPLETVSIVSHGLHNVPELWGDDVRPLDRITGARSGMKVASKEFGYGLYDGLSGLVLQPVKGAKEEGIIGFGKGIFKGGMGVAFRPASGLSGLFGYTADGIIKQCEKFGYVSAKDYIRVSRLTQGFDEMQQASPEKKAEILERWQTLKLEQKRKGKKKAVEPQVQ